MGRKGYLFARDSRSVVVSNVFCTVGDDNALLSIIIAGSGRRGSLSNADGDVPIAMKRAPSSNPNDRGEPNPKTFSEENQEDEKVSQTIGSYSNRQ